MRQRLEEICFALAAIGFALWLGYEHTERKRLERQLKVNDTVHRLEIERWVRIYENAEQRFRVASERLKEERDGSR